MSTLSTACTLSQVSTKLLRCLALADAESRRTAIKSKASTGLSTADAGFAIVDGKTLKANAVKCVGALGLIPDSSANASERGQLNPRLYWQCSRVHNREESLAFSEGGTRWIPGKDGEGMKIRSPLKSSKSDAEFRWDGKQWVSAEKRPDLKPP